jgi:hypothetical protein
MRILLSVLGILAASSVMAHDHDHPELDAWYRSLSSPVGGFCCDGSDALSILDPDWETTADPENPYRVKFEGEWLTVRKGAVVSSPNKAGVAKVWPVKGGRGEKTDIRCFLPGAEI